ncbi:hypothetical protein DFQ28_004313 [Apophysomyces sp. BC1034]|nr:hypothetical protein DFQ30_004366 [Apophysomyces sp. BC1015]KAG0178412.1 hypothetical protein DFQ29_003483 [Apophysomyces sp. BC1021]KAG0188820.1 hypothetical protein DFQ28_004313 [Apophysomyces sp. BC1034]
MAASRKPQRSSWTPSSNRIACPPGSGSCRDGGVMDPHIDAFEIFGAQITRITRTMQQFHVDDLCREGPSRDRRQKHERSSTAPGEIVSCPSQSRRVSRISSECSHATGEPEKISQDAHGSNNTEPWERSDSHGERLRKNPSTLTTLLLTTNTLIQSRLSEETVSITPYDRDSSSATWRSQFRDLMSDCITHAEQLECLSTELLESEMRVRELLFMDHTIGEHFHAREKAYEERLREYREASQQQIVMIESLEELMADLEMKMESLQGFRHACDSDTRCTHQKDGHWDFRRTISDILNMEDKNDLVQKTRWEAGMMFGGGVGAGRLIHAFEGRLHGMEMIIAGVGTAPEESSAVGQPFGRSGFRRHRYVLRLLPEDRQRLFVLLPKHHWVRDEQADRCQLKHRREMEEESRCSTVFGLFERRHHCRR